jgi:hypothetical protein
MYNLINGVNPASFLILPMLGKHPEEYPRFRDCFVDKDSNICIYTRIGGGNRENYKEEIEEMRYHSSFIKDFDDDGDCTYATFVFSVPEKWKIDFEKIMNNNIKNISKEYKTQMKKVYPKLAGKFDEMFNAWQTVDNSD